MPHVLTLVSHPDCRLDDNTAAAARAALQGLGARADTHAWLAPGHACDIPFADLDCDQAASAVRQALGDAPIDAVAQPTSGRRKRLLVADMDSTIITAESLDELAVHAGLHARIAAITERAMNGEIDFREAVRERVGLLAGLPVSALESVREKLRLTAGARTLVRTMRKYGAYTVLISGGFRFFTGRVREAAGFDLDVANELEVADGKLTGQVRDPILNRDGKLDTLMRIAGERQIPLAETLAVGDGANDLPMLQAAGLGVAFHAKPVVAAGATARIEHGDLIAVLYLQGYREGDLVRD